MATIGASSSHAACARQVIARLDDSNAAAAIAVIGGEVQRYLGLAVLTEPKR